MVDAIERAAIAGFVTFVGCHGRRWAWLAAGAAIAVSARGASLVFVLVALAIIALSAVPRRRARSNGSVALAFLVNAVFWFPESTPAWGVALAVLGLVIVVGSGVPHLRSRTRRPVKVILIATAAFVVVAGAAAVVAMGLAYRNVQTGSNAAGDALNAARNGDGPRAADQLMVAQDEFDHASSQVGGPFALPAKLVPGLAQQVQAVESTVDQGEAIASAGDELVATADYDRLTYDGRLDLAQVQALAPPTSQADAVLTQARSELRHLRGGSLLPPLADRIDQFATDIDEARKDTSLAADLLETTPDLFGASGPRRYLILFLTPAELRGGGGFIGSYAELEIIDGKAELTRSGRIDDLLTGPNKGNRTISGPADYLARYGRFHPDVFLQDVTQTPNFPSSAAVMAELYPQAGGQPVDGVISVDPKGLAALLQLTGPVTVPNLPEPLTTDNAADYLVRRQYLEMGDRADRGEVLEGATRATFEKLVDSALPAPRTLANTLSPVARAGHLRLWSPDPDEQALFRRLGATGDLAVPKGADGFSVVQQNGGNNKLDAYLNRTITYDAEVDAATGALTSVLQIELRNDLPSVDLPASVVSNSRGLPVGTNLASLTVFTPDVVTSAEIDGKAVTLGPGTERGLNAWDTPLLQIPPGGKVVVTLRLRGAVDLTSGYRQLILPQPVANPDRFTSTLRVKNGQVRGTGATEQILVDDQPLEAPTSFRVPIQR